MPHIFAIILSLATNNLQIDMHIIFLNWTPGIGPTQFSPLCAVRWLLISNPKILSRYALCLVGAQ